jgi:hypothetical protein
MNPKDDPLAEELDSIYQQASAKQAGSPSASTREAILAQAKATALRRTPAANDSRYLWRAAAGVAVFGVALLLWRQTNPQLDVGRVAEPTFTVEADPVQPQRSAPVAETRERPDRDALAVAPSARPGTAAAPATAAPKAAAQAAATPESEAQAPALAKAESAASSTLERSRRESAAGAANMSAAADRATADRAPELTSDESLLRRHFAVQFESDSPASTLWLLQDAAGNMLRTGSLDTTTDFGAVTATLQRDFPGQQISTWRVVPVTNARGQQIQLGIAKVE